MQIYSLSMACIEEGKKTEGEGNLKVEERTFGLSIERFRFFWWMYASAYRLPDRAALQFWRIVAFVAEACEKAQGITRDELWAKRRERAAAIERLRAAGAPLPPELEPPAPRFKLKTRAERARERGEVVTDDVGQ